jgi:hypothetical protein
LHGRLAATAVKRPLVFSRPSRCQPIFLPDCKQIIDDDNENHYHNRRIDLTSRVDEGSGAAAKPIDFSNPTVMDMA